MQNSVETLPAIPTGMKQHKQWNRVRFWEMADFFPCPIVGLCLNLSEQVHLLKKSGVPIRKLSLFRMHELLVCSSRDENPLSRKVDNLLVQKFSSKTEPLTTMTEEELVQQWRACFNDGEYIEIFWYLASRSNLSMEFCRAVFGDIHMSMHRNSEERADLVRRTNMMREKSRKAEERADEENKKRKSLQKEIELQQREMEKLKIQLAFSEKQRIALGSKLAEAKDLKQSAVTHELQRENMKLKADIATISAKATSSVEQVTRLKLENKKLTADLLRQSQYVENLQKEIHEMIRQTGIITNCDESCPSFDLCKKRVLVVGGISKMEFLYRQMIEHNGGVFEYHDGYVKGGAGRLESSFRRADIVLCPVNCNSHAACTLVKQLGKKHKKPVQMLSGSGLNAILRGIQSTGVESLT